MTLPFGTVKYTLGTVQVTGCSISGLFRNPDTVLAWPVAE